MKAQATHLSDPAGRLRQADELPGHVPDAMIAAAVAGIAASTGAGYLLLPNRGRAVATRRLLVLVPEGDLDENDLARRIWTLAGEGVFDILFLFRSRSPVAEAPLRRRAATLAALTRGQYLDVRDGTGWVEAVRDIWRTGDLLVCVDGHRTLFRSLGTYLSSRLDVPVYMLTGLRLGPSPRAQRAVRESIAWLMALLIIVGFAWLQIATTQAVDGALSTVLLCLSILVEVGALLKLFEFIG